jgi:asparagine synthase (glutamine-hydrolysing)
MCAIVGLFTPHATDPAELKALAERMQAAHQFRGPDGNGVWCNEHVAIGSVRLAIHGDRKLGIQPLTDRWGGRLVFNGEVMEPDAVLRSLGEAPHPDESDGVALEAILALRGPMGLDGLRGMFAAARYDSSDGSLTLARDRWGQKPLYLTRWREGWAFASTVAALSVVSEPLRLRSAAPLEYLIYKSVGGLHSFFDGIEQVAPASWMQFVPDGTFRSGRYSVMPEDCSAVATLKQVRNELDAAVLVRAADGFENALLLSGGADSSIVATSLVRQRPDLKLRAFSISYDATGYEDESDYARRLAKVLEIPHEIVRLSADQVPQLSEEVAKFSEDLIEDPVTLPTLLLARRVGEYTKVALSGDGSDEFWGGYARFDNPPRTLSEYLPRSMAFRPDELGLTTPPATYLDEIPMPSEELAPLDRILRLEASHRLRNYHLARLDKLGMAAAVEIRNPFVDAHVTRLALSLPAETKRPGGRPKGLLLDAFTSDLPDWLIHRRKQPFTVPITAWLTGALRPYARDTLGAGNAWVRTFVNPEPYLERLDQRPDLETATRIWSLLQLEAWHRVWRSRLA